MSNKSEESEINTRRVSPYSSFYINDTSESTTSDSNNSRSISFKNRNLEKPNQNIETVNVGNSKSLTNSASTNTNSISTNNITNNSYKKDEQLSYESNKNLNTHSISPYSSSIKAENYDPYMNNSINTTNSSNYRITSTTNNFTSTKDNDPYIEQGHYNAFKQNNTQDSKQQLNHSVTSSSNLSNETLMKKLKGRYINLAYRNPELVPKEHSGRIKFWYVTKTLFSCGYFVYVFLFFNRMVSRPSDKSLYRKAILIFTGYAAISLLFAIHNDSLYIDSFNLLFYDMKPNDIEAKLDEFKQTIIPVKY